MGILNITPDSFSDGSQYNTQELAYQRALKMKEVGVDILDIGGESTRPGAKNVSVQEEIDRVIPIISKIKSLDVSISIDSNKPEVMEAAVLAGANLINDVRALQNEGAIEMAAKLQVPVCLMHMQGLPQNMQNAPNYSDVVTQVQDFLVQRIKQCQSAGIDKSLISIDPGFGFGKKLSHNLELLSRLEEFSELEVPILVGLSRKSMLGEITGQPVSKRLAASLAVSQIAMQKGARIIRVHDVEETNDLRQVFMAMKDL